MSYCQCQGCQRCHPEWTAVVMTLNPKPACILRLTDLPMWHACLKCTRFRVSALGAELAEYLKAWLLTPLFSLQAVVHICASVLTPSITRNKTYNTPLYTWRSVVLISYLVNCNYKQVLSPVTTVTLDIIGL